MEQGLVKDLLAKLHRETFILDLSAPLSPEALQGPGAATTRVVDRDTLEIDLGDGRDAD